MRILPLRIARVVPNFSPLAEQLRPDRLFHWTRFIVDVHSCFFPLRWRRSLRPLFEVLKPRFSEDSLNEIARRYCVIRKWRRYLLEAWPAVVRRHEQWFSFEGLENVDSAMRQGRGVLLLSPHSFGFGRFVAPVLAQRNYPCHRVGLGWQGDDISDRWGKREYKKWHHIHYRWESWKNIAALKKMKAALQRNEIVHVSLRGLSKGEARFQMPFWYKEYFFDARLLRAIEFYRTSVIPCFSRLGDHGKVIVVFDRAIASDAAAIVEEFGALYRNWLEAYPEHSRIWKRVFEQREDW